MRQVNLRLLAAQSTPKPSRWSLDRGPVLKQGGLTREGLLLPPMPGQQPHQRIEERPHRRGVLGELVAQHYRRVDADRILARVNRGLGRLQLIIVSGTAITK